MSRWILVAAVVCNALLIAVAVRVIYGDARRRAREIDARTRELIELSTHLQGVAEREKATLARELHDELGGLLVGARMDISWAEQHLTAADADMKHRLHRVQQNLSAGIDLKRRIIEELRPTLLDNVGFLAALRWQFKETCGNAGIVCTEFFPAEEPRFSADAAIALFRVAQEAFANVLKHSGAKNVSISLDIDQDTVVFRVKDDGSGIVANGAVTGTHGLSSMRHRVSALDGSFEMLKSSPTGTELIVRLPIARALRPGSELETL